ncbi:UBE2V2, partial [Symbiodinium sp. KB8]
LVTLEDTLMNNWQGTIVQAAGGGSDVRVWFLSLVAGPDYPTQCPTIKFTSKINMTGVDSKGNVDPSKIAYLKDWQPSNTLKGALTAIKAAIGSAPRSQPEDGETY